MAIFSAWMFWLEFAEARPENRSASESSDIDQLECYIALADQTCHWNTVRSIELESLVGLPQASIEDYLWALAASADRDKHDSSASAKRTAACAEC